MKWKFKKNTRIKYIRYNPNRGKHDPQIWWCCVGKNEEEYDIHCSGRNTLAETLQCKSFPEYVSHSTPEQLEWSQRGGSFALNIRLSKR